MAHEIVMIQQMGDALRNTGYKSIESAISEIIDNSIEAEAREIFVLVSESVDSRTGRKAVSEFAFLDNGIGMSIEKLESCLGIGFTTRSDRKGMGRFGVGLPQSSLHVCPSVDVYSWQNGYDNCHKVFLDINKVKAGVQERIDDPKKSEIPDKFKKFLKYKTEDKQYDFTKSGTFVHWKACDRVSPKTVNFLFKTLEFALGRKFRYLIKNNTHNIKIIHIENESYSKDVMPNDPLFLMNPNYVLGNPDHPENINPRYNEYCTESLFEPYINKNCEDGCVVAPVKYYAKKKNDDVDADEFSEITEIKESTVKIRFSKVRDIFYDKTAISGDPGGTEMGKHVAKMEGISIVRAGREIDIGRFDFYKSINQPQHRWWGCEICFDPELDEAFGVANNKQYVELKELEPTDYEGEDIQPMWLQLESVISNTIKKIYGENQQTRSKSRTINDIGTPASEIVNAAEEGSEAKGETDSVKENTSSEELVEKTKEALKEQGVESPTDADAVSYMNNKVNIEYRDCGRGPFFDYSFSLGTCLITINTSDIFYQKFLEPIIGNVDTKTTFELFLAAFVKTIDDKIKGDKKDISDIIVQEWNAKLKNYISVQQGYGK